MPEVFVGIGSNIDRERNVRSGLDALHRHFGPLRVSPVYLSEAIGFDGADFLNLVVAFNTAMPLAELAWTLREIEGAHGRPADIPKYSSRSLDLDVLLYGDQVGEFGGLVLPRGEITENAFVLRPLAELAPQTCHPRLGESFAALWEAYDQSRQRLTEVPFDWEPKNT